MPSTSAHFGSSALHAVLGRGARPQPTGTRNAMALRAASLAAAAATLAAAAPHSFIAFEAELLPQWLALFQLDSSPGNYSFLPHGNESSVYAASDVAHLLYTVNQLNLTGGEAAAWAGVINRFQNQSGFYTPYDYEAVCGFVPWHTNGFATAALGLLGQAPAYPPQWAADIAAGGQQLWEETFLPLLNCTGQQGCNTVWCCGHKIASIPAVLQMAGLLTSQYPDFASWWLSSFLPGNLDPATGMWCTNPAWAPPSYVCLGGAFHIEFVETALGAAWALPETVLNTSLHLQKPGGYWGAPAVQFIDLDGVYQVVRPAVQLGRPPALWAAARASCDAYLGAAAAALSNATLVLTAAHGGYGGNTHSLVGAVAGVAECAKWFPDLVLTTRPWRQGLDVAPFI